jgi:hypothetical protein
LETEKDFRFWILDYGLAEGLTIDGGSAVIHRPSASSLVNPKSKTLFVDVSRSQ